MAEAARDDTSLKQAWAARAASMENSPRAWRAAIAEAVAAKDFALAEAGFAMALQRFPEHLDLLVGQAELAAAQGRYGRAFARWQRIYPAHPQDITVALGYAELLVRRGHLEEAETVLGAVAGRAPEAELGPRWVRLLLLHARVALARGFPAEAAARAARVRPHVTVGRPVAARLAELEADIAAADAAPGGAARAEGDAALLLRFESLGASCEFGLVQRGVGAEPLGLLRWVGIAAPDLVRCLENDFQGVGEPAFTRLTGGVDGSEFRTTDARFPMSMHTFVWADGQDRERFFAQSCRRLQFLRRKLLEDLAEGEKIFVFRAREETVAADLPPLVAALRRHNPRNRLLTVWESPAGTAASPVVEDGPGLFSCTIARGRTPSNDWKIDMRGWLAACRETAARA